MYNEIIIKKIKFKIWKNQKYILLKIKLKIIYILYYIDIITKYFFYTYIQSLLLYNILVL